MRHSSIFGIAVTVAIAGCVPAARATTITGPFALHFSNGSGALVDVGVVTTTPSGSLGNTLIWTEDIQSLDGPGASWSLAFSLTGGPAGSTQYLATKTVINNTGAAWNNLLIYMGCDVGFTPCGPSGLGPVNVDYSLVPIPTMSVPGTLELALPHLLHWTGMNVGDGQQVQFTFGINTFDCGQGACSATWQISETSAPEPTSLALLGTGLAVLWRRRSGRATR
jgi:hypothetical protein